MPWRLRWTTMIELTHIGGSLIAEMLNSSPKVRQLLGDKLGPLFLQGEAMAVAELSLGRCAQYMFDEAHGVDVGLLLPETSQCVPIELKLGADRLAKSDFDKRFLQPCKTSHAGTRISGSMISVLERKLPVPEGEAVETCHQGVNYKLTAEWILIVREQVLSAWNASETPALSANCKIVTMESVVAAYGDKKDFNDLVTKLLSADYYDKWFGAVSPLS